MPLLGNHYGAHYSESVSISSDCISSSRLSTDIKSSPNRKNAIIKTMSPLGICIPSLSNFLNALLATTSGDSIAVKFLSYLSIAKIVNGDSCIVQLTVEKAIVKCVSLPMTHTGNCGFFRNEPT